MDRPLFGSVRRISATRVTASLAAVNPAETNAVPAEINVAMAVSSGATAARIAPMAAVIVIKAAADIVADARRAVRPPAVKPCQPLRFESH